ncbi:MAG: membrane dipeptidase [Burkholderiales bacterium]|jgi:membrane dipeptidase|nr:membrane dipeptidase [Burkholderiales bacterium]
MHDFGVLGWSLSGLLALALVWTVLVRFEILTAERLFGVKALPPHQTGPAAQELHKTLIVADLHADTLIWRRDLLRRSNLGHFDFPRMADGGVAVQGFLVVTEAPREVIGGHLSDKSDRLTALGAFDQWPLPAIVDQTVRALYLGRKLERFAERSKGRVRLVRNRDELQAVLDARHSGQDVRAVYLGLEGSDGTKHRPENLDRLFRAGFRMSELCHYTDTAFAASSSGVSGGGLTALGFEAVQEMDRLGMLVDLAHASPRTISDVLNTTRRPPLITHTGSGSCHHDPKCLPDELLIEVVQRGGVIGLGFVSDYVGGEDFASVSHALDHLVKILGPEGVALGSGFCALPMPIPVDHFPRITEALMERGYTQANIAAVMGGNAVRYLLTNLPNELG